MSSGITRRTILRTTGTVAGAAALAPLAGRPAFADSLTSQGSGLAWPADRALPLFAQPDHLDVVDLSGTTAEEQMLFSTLQGLVARKQPALYGLWPGSNEEVWLGRLGVPNSPLDLWSAVKRYLSAARGTVVYDPGLPHSINVATTLAGLRDGVVADPELAAKLAAPPYGLKPLADLRGRFATKLDAYTWQFGTLWPHCTHRLLSGFVPYGVQPVARTSDYQQLLIQATHVHDSSNRAVRTIDLSRFLGSGPIYVRFEDSFPSEGWGPQVFHVTLIADGVTIADFDPTAAGEEPYLYDNYASALIAPEMTSTALRFADVNDYWVYRFTPPAGTQDLTLKLDIANQFAVYGTTVQQPISATSHPFGHLADYQVATRAMAFSLDPNMRSERDLFAKIAASVAPSTPYRGWFPGDVGGEWAGVGLLSQHSVYVLADDYGTNMTVHAGIRRPPRRSLVAAAPPLDKKIYLTFCVSDGDNLQYCEHRLQQIWDDPGRGKVPITWTIQPHLVEAMPDILDYYQRTATANDCFMTGASGAGYMAPDQWPDDTFPQYAHTTHDLMQRLNWTTVSVLNYRNWSVTYPLSGTKATDYAEIIRPLGIAAPSNAPQLIILDGTTPESDLSGAGDVPSMLTLISELSAGWDGNSPAFFALQPSGWTMTPTDLATVAQSLDERYQVVRADQFFELIRQAHDLPDS